MSLLCFGVNYEFWGALKEREYEDAVLRVNDKIERMYKRNLKDEEVIGLKNMEVEVGAFLNGCVDHGGVSLVGKVLGGAIMGRGFVWDGEKVFCEDGEGWGEEEITDVGRSGREEEEFEREQWFGWVGVCKSEEGNTEGYVIFRKMKSVIVEGSSGTQVHEFTDLEKETFKHIAALIGQTLTRVRERVTERKALKDRGTENEVKVKKMEEREIKRKAKMEFDGFKDGKDREAQKHEILRLKTRVITLEKFGKGQESRRIATERLLEKTKTDASHIISNLRRATEKKNEDIKRLVNKHMVEHGGLLKQNHSLGKDRERLEEEVIKLKKENAKLNSEVENYRLHKKANDVLVKNHKELTQKVDILIKSSAKKQQKVKKENRELFTPTRLNLKATTTTPKKT
ncbi:hypothetical protein TrVE_jg3530 [Triparma verrucosa]|uniref:Uncharacterized protein n=1 Tax=Triparma verrucosa TaxID=1606542 RepID=A0A9W7B4E1_9STRA|nr:hypothetical protein TrVE_jg3530 [Triparma verrucosa]